MGSLVAELATAALVVLALAAGGILAHRLGLPSALGYLAVGITVRTSGVVDLDLHLLEGVSEVAVLVLLFFIGLELDIRRLREALRSTAWTTPFDIALPGVAVATLARLMGWGFLEAVALGITVSVSSTLFGERFTALPGVSAASRQRVIGVLVSEDVAAAALIALLVILAGGDGWLGPALAVGQLGLLLILITVAALLVVPRMLDEVARRHVPDLLVLWAVGLVVFFGYLGHLAGSAELGALLAGVAAAESGSRYVVRNNVTGVRDLAAAAFFFASGLAVDGSLLLDGLVLAIAVAVVFLLAKTLVHVPAALASGLPLRSSLHTAFALVAVGEFSLILVTVAEREGLAHPALRTTVITAMVLLLPAAAFLMRATPAVERAVWRLPRRVRNPLSWLVVGLHRRDRAENDKGERRAALRRLTANLLLILGWSLLAAWLRPVVRLPWPDAPSFADTAIWLGLTIGVATPLALGAYRAYRELVWHLVGIRPGERAGAGRVRARLVDAWVALSAFLALVVVSLRLPQALPALVGAGLVALTVVVLAWRRLNQFHKMLETTLGRVLGQDVETAAFLDHVLSKYPWGVRFIAVSVPPGSPLAGQSLRESRLALLTGATLAVLQRGRDEIVNPGADERVRVGDTLVLLGDVHQLARAEAFVVAHGEAVRMSAQSVTANIAELALAQESEWVGRSLGEAGVKERTGCLVVGVWRDNNPHPQPYRPDMDLRVGDKLILLGTPLQLERAKVVAAGVPEARPPSEGPTANV